MVELAAVLVPVVVAVRFVVVIPADSVAVPVVVTPLALAALVAAVAYYLPLPITP